MTEHLKPTLLWQLKSYLKSGSIFFGITSFFLLILWATSHFFGVKNMEYLGGCSITGCVLFFVFGLTSRSDLRLYLQLGISRRTTFWATLSSILTTAAVLSLWSEVLLSVLQAMEPQIQILHLADLFSVLYLEALPASAMSISQHLQSLLFNFLLAVLMFAGGSVLSFLFLRLKSLLSTIITAGTFLAVIILFPMLSRHLPDALMTKAEAFMEIIQTSGWSALAFLLILNMIFFLIAWLLIRTANPWNEMSWL